MVPNNSWDIQTEQIKTENHECHVTRFLEFVLLRSELIVSVLCDIANPGQCLISTLFNNLQVPYLKPQTIFNEFEKELMAIIGLVHWITHILYCMSALRVEMSITQEHIAMHSSCIETSALRTMISVAL